MLEKYIKLKEKYPKSLIMIKAGNFYDCINDDAIIINKLFNYNINDILSNNILNPMINNIVSSIEGSICKIR